MKKVFGIFIWFVWLMAVWTFCAEMISAANTIMVLLGLGIAIGFIYLTYKTKFFTKWKK